MGRALTDTTLVWQARVDLAACYHLCDQMDMNEGICNHLTVMVPGTTDRFLCIPYGLLWTEVTASNLLLLDDAERVWRAKGRSTPPLSSSTRRSTRPA